MNIILDNGHGRGTPGKRSPIWPDGTQLFEWEFTRDIVKRIHSDLSFLKIDSVILVPEAFDISLKTRVDRANKLFTDYPKSILLSVHGNASVNPNTGSGWEVWTSPGQTESDKFANCIYSAAEQILFDFKMRSDKSDGDPDKESKFYILSETWCPAVLTENLFYDNEKDCRFMLSEEGRQLITKIHVKGIQKYLSTIKS